MPCALAGKTTISTHTHVKTPTQLSASLRVIQASTLQSPPPKPGGGKGSSNKTKGVASATKTPAEMRGRNRTNPSTKIQGKHKM
mmetsp:Transcript_6000/g.8941  ORF Transcript_6000/g.8941 Transcript_6000/m.8941 type:complete len:84 (+) Transcript_6000:224-475(+)